MFSILAFTETWIKPSTSPSEYEIPGFNQPYTYIRQDRIGGGVSVYVKPNIVAKRRCDLEVKNVECVWLELFLSGKKILLGTFYRPPNTGSEYWNLINHSIDLALSTKNENVVIIGDFNCNQLNDNHNEIRKILDTFTLYQILNEPTHYTEHSNSLIDLIITNNPNIISASGVSDPFLSNEIRYHCPIYAMLNIPKRNKTTFTRKIWIFKNTNFDGYRSKLSTIDWDPIISNDSIDNSASILTETIVKTASETIPNKQVTIRKNDLPWINNSIRKLIRKRRRIHKKAKYTNNTDDWSKFRILRNKCIALIRKCQTEYFDNLAEKLKHSSNSKDWWKLANQLSGFNITKSEIPPIKKTDDCYEDIDMNKTQLFNEYFITQSTVDDSGVDLPPLTYNQICSIDNIDITETNVKDVLSLSFYI